MPIRSVKPRSDRGNIKDVFNDNDLGNNEPPDPMELRMRDLYEYASLHKDEVLKESLGFIVMNQPGDKSAFPITLYRHREYVNSLNKKMSDRIAKTSLELSKYISYPPESSSMKKSLSAVLNSNELIKVAGIGTYTKPQSSFKRVR